MLTYVIMKFIQHLESIEVLYRYTDLDKAFAQQIVLIPKNEDGTFKTGAELDSGIRAQAMPREWFEEQQLRLTGASSSLVELPPEIAKVVPVSPVKIVPKWHEDVIYGDPVLVNGEWFRNPEVIDISGMTPLPELKIRLSAEITRIRYERETGGILVNGAKIQTDRESQATVAGAWAKAKSDPNVTINWKTMAGWVELTAQAMIEIGDAVFNHVQHCFNRERELQILCADATDSETLLAIDTQGGW